MRRSFIINVKNSQRHLGRSRQNREEKGDEESKRGERKRIEGRRGLRDKPGAKRPRSKERARRPRYCMSKMAEVI